MKKTYIQPSIEEVKIENMNLLAGSPEPKFDPSLETDEMESRFGDLF